MTLFSILVLAVSAIVAAAPAQHIKAEHSNFFPIHRLRARDTRQQTGAFALSPLGTIGLGAYYTPVKIGTQTFNLIIDTGSSDTWVPDHTVVCQNFDQNTLPLSQCGFGGFYTPESDFKKINDELFITQYGTPSITQGYFGTVDVTVAGITWVFMFTSCYSCR